MIRASFKLLLILLWTVLMFPPVWIALRAKRIDWRDWCIRTHSKVILRIVGVHLHVNGEVSPARPLLLVSNHLSYLDIPILSSLLNARFTPKKEIAGWPVIGSICKMTDCIFVERRPNKVKEVGNDIHTALKKGDIVSLFPEATTGDGIRVLPFKSSFFSLAEEHINGQELLVQPVAFTYTRLGKLPIDSGQWHAIAWYGDMALEPHVWELLQLGSLDVELRFLPPVTFSQFGDRKKLAQYCQQTIADTIEHIKQEPVSQPRNRSLTSWASKLLSSRQ